MLSFAAEIEQSLTGELTLPTEFVAALDWMENVGAVGKMSSGERYATTDPSGDSGSDIYFHAVDPRVVPAWTGSNAPDLDRLAPIVRTGGDGSMAALWRDDEGQTQIVHMGSGSGSISVGLFTRNALDFLRLLAVGYQELCWPDSYDLLPIDACYDRTTYQPPTRFRSWLTTTFGVAIPATAAPLVLPMADMGEPSDDPFCKWLNARIG